MIKFQITREMLGKTPWYLFIAVLLSVLIWPTKSDGSQSALTPAVVLFYAASMRMFFSLRMEDYREARHAWMTGIVSLILGIILLDDKPNNLVFIESAILAWATISIFLTIYFRRFSPIEVLWGSIIIAASAALTIDYQRWFQIVIVGIAICELLLTTFMLTFVNWSSTRSALLSALQKSNESDLSAKLAASIVTNEPIVRRVSNLWIFLIIVILLGTHLERMGFTGNLGILPPIIALVGDLKIALLLSFLIILPFRLMMARFFQIYEERFISIMAHRASWPIFAALLTTIYTSHLRLKIRLTEARFSLFSLLRQGLVTGLPVVALLTGIVPLLGTNWFFNTEEWATMVRDNWSAANADQWRIKMVSAANPDANRSLLVDIPGLDSKDFSFVVVGDPGQGGLSQRELAKQIVKISENDAVKFVLVSSDVVYPNGEMKDYEAKFWSPLSGLLKPIVAIPGNHDWYDGLDSFAATFFTRDAARAAINARNNDGRADRLVEKADTFRGRYGLITQLQTAPYFKVETEEFVLICLDTGVVGQVDNVQMDWLRRGLEDAKGKTVMVLLGNPLFAMNRNKTLEQPGLAPILDLLRRENVSIVMAGDTHDLEFYLDTSNPAHPMYHFVNGGGGAYIAIGRALGSPQEPIMERWAYHPTREAIVEKLDAEVPPLIRPFWWMAKRKEGQVWYTDLFSTALDRDKSPFLNSFLVVHVETSQKQIRIIPYGVHGRLKWTDFALSADQKISPQDYAEWLVPMLSVR